MGLYGLGDGRGKRTVVRVVATMPEAELPIDAALVAALLTEQHADLAGLPLEAVGEGWDNVTFRLGDALAVRLPRRRAAAHLVLHEQRWLPTLAPLLPISVPAPVRTGAPGCGYPWAWSVVPWFEGTHVGVTPFTDPRREAARLGAFLRALHVPAPTDAPRNPYRGVPLGDRAALFDRTVAQLGDRIDAVAVRTVWEAALAVPVFRDPPVWLHGDLHALNLVARAGTLVAVVDFGDLTAGDPATDLAVAWQLFDAPDRAVLRAAAGADADAWERARGWALALSLIYLANSADLPDLHAVGERTLERVLVDG